MEKTSEREELSVELSVVGGGRDVEERTEREGASSSVRVSARVPSSQLDGGGWRVRYDHCPWADIMGECMAGLAAWSEILGSRSPFPGKPLLRSLCHSNTHGHSSSALTPPATLGKCGHNQRELTCVLRLSPNFALWPRSARPSSFGHSSGGKRWTMPGGVRADARRRSSRRYASFSVLCKGIIGTSGEAPAEIVWRSVHGGGARGRGCGERAHSTRRTVLVFN